MSARRACGAGRRVKRIGTDSANTIDNDATKIEEE